MERIGVYLKMGKKIKYGLFDYSCGKCGQRVSGESRYCEHCGTHFRKIIEQYKRLTKES